MTWAQEPGASRDWTYQDEDRNGINDRFCDANGDGVNDISGEPYRHSFRFEDSDGDGVNDLWRDEDGDGVNDLMRQLRQRSRVWVDRDGDGIADEETAPLSPEERKAYVMDEDGDGKNDITGEPCTGPLSGFRYGKVDEERGIRDDEYRDKNGNGTNDRFETEPGRGAMDRFMDRDGDGVDDERGWKRLQKRRGKRGRG